MGISAGLDGAIQVLIDGDVTGLKDSVEEARMHLKGFAQYTRKIGMEMASAGRYMTVALTAPIALLAKASFSHFAALDEGMHNIATIERELSDSSILFEKRWRKILNLSVKYGQQVRHLVKANYDIASAGYKGAEGMEVLEVSTMGAVAGLATVDQSAKAIVSVLNAYGATGKEAISMAWDLGNILFRTVEKGVLTFAEISKHLGAAVAAASSAGIAFDEVSAAIATMTKQGIDAAEGFTSLNRFILRLTQSSSKINELFKDTEYRTAGVALRMKGLGWVSQFIADKTGGTSVALQEYGLMVRDLKAGLAVTRNEGKIFSELLGEIADKTNRTNSMFRAFITQTRSVSFQIKRLKALWSAFTTELWFTFRPSLIAVLNELQKLIIMFRELNTSTKKILVVIALVAAALGPVLLLLGYGLIVISNIASMVVMLGTAGIIAMGAFLWKIIWVAAAAFALYKMLDMIYRQFSDKDISLFQAVWDPRQEGFQGGLEENIGVVRETLKALGTLISIWGRMLTWIFRNIGPWLGGLVTIVHNGLMILIEMVKSGFGLFKILIKNLFEYASQFVRPFLDLIMNAFKNLFQALANLWTAWEEGGVKGLVQAAKKALDKGGIFDTLKSDLSPEKWAAAIKKAKAEADNVVVAPFQKQLEAWKNAIGSVLTTRWGMFDQAVQSQVETAKEIWNKEFVRTWEELVYFFTGFPGREPVAMEGATSNKELVDYEDRLRGGKNMPLPAAAPQYAEAALRGSAADYKAMLEEYDVKKKDRQEELQEVANQRLQNIEALLQKINDFARGSGFFLDFSTAGE